MDWQKIPGLSQTEQAALAEHHEAHLIHSTRVLGAAYPGLYETREPGAAAERLARSLERMSTAYDVLSALASGDTPGRAEGQGYGELLATLARLGVGDRDGKLADDPEVPWHALPAPRLLLYCLLDLDEYFYLTRRAPSSPQLPRLHDLGEGVRSSMSEEEIAAGHGERHELLIRLYRLLDLLGSEDGASRKQRMYGLGYECGYDGGVFYTRYEHDQDYLDGFVEAALELIGEEGCEEDRELAAYMSGLWNDPAAPEAEKHENVVEILKFDYRVAADEGELWRL